MIHVVSDRHNVGLWCSNRSAVWEVSVLNSVDDERMPSVCNAKLDGFPE